MYKSFILKDKSLGLFVPHEESTANLEGREEVSKKVIRGMMEISLSVMSSKVIQKG